MKGERFEITRGTDHGSPEDPTRTYRVRKRSWPEHKTITVTVDRHASGRVMTRCCSCSGPLVAALTTCAHAQAVRRYLQKRAKQEPHREEAIEELRRAVDFYDRARASPDGASTGGLRDGHEWVLTAARKVIA